MDTAFGSFFNLLREVKEKREIFEAAIRNTGYCQFGQFRIGRISGRHRSLQSAMRSLRLDAQLSADPKTADYSLIITE